MSDSARLPLPDYEPTDGPARLVLLTAAGLAVGLGLTLAASAWVYRSGAGSRPAVSARGPEFFFEHGPGERTGIERDWEKQDRLVRERLQSYGWVDREAGVVRIPIERAMEKLGNERPAANRRGSP
jgi:hypothetical protein